MVTLLFAQAVPCKNKGPGYGGKPGLLSLVAGKRNQRYLQALRAKIPSLPISQDA